MGRGEGKGGERVIVNPELTLSGKRRPVVRRQEKISMEEVSGRLGSGSEQQPEGMFLLLFSVTDERECGAL